ncbi:MAG: TonB-dependent receptor domain-containing protein [Blastocatellia bacterium]
MYFHIMLKPFRYLSNSALAVLCFLIALSISGQAQNTGVIKGTVRLDGPGTPLHDAAVSIVRLNRTAMTDEQGAYEFRDVPPGRWEIHAHVDGFPDAVQAITVGGSQVAVNFSMKLSGLRDQIVITANGREQSAFESFQSVVSLDNTELAARAQPSLGEVLDHQPGIAKRSFGPGSSRPIIRGFDGDRVLVLQDGLNLGAIGSQSGDHGEPVDAMSLDRIEVVKGPASLLYGSNAIGGVVNAVTGHNLVGARPHKGTRGYLTGSGGSNNNLGAGSAGLEAGTENFLFWANASGQRTGDYHTPFVGRIENSAARNAGGSGGLGWYGQKGWLSAGYAYDNRRYGIPFAGLIAGEEDALIDLDMRRHGVNVNFGYNNLPSVVENIQLSLSYSDYRHRELEIDGAVENVGTIFDNDVFSYRGVFEQKTAGLWTGRFGFQGSRRQYTATGAEALAPPVTQNNTAVFTLQEFGGRRAALQLGGRLEHNGYAPGRGRARDFTGFSGSAGVRLSLWEGGAVVANYNHSYRAPALEELYNNGPHPGNLTFEIGDEKLGRERGDGLELSLRHSTARARAEFNFFHYKLRDFIFLAPTGAIEDGLPEAEYEQADATYRGMELNLEANIAPALWLRGGVDYVRAGLDTDNRPLPRIPPLRGRLGFDWRPGGFSLRPELIMTRDQDRVFTNETRTPGYAVVNLDTSYTWTREHIAHIIGASFFNLGDRAYYNHSSLIKNLAPEIGRGVRVYYTLRFF